MPNRKWLACFFTFLIAVSVDVYSLGLGAEGGANLQFNTTDEFAVDLRGAASLLIWQNWGGHWGFNADFSPHAASAGLSLDWMVAAGKLASFGYSGTTNTRPEVANPLHGTLNLGFGPGLFVDYRWLPNDGSTIKEDLSVGVRLPVILFLSLKDEWSEETKSTFFLQVAPRVASAIASFDKDFGYKDLKFSAACTIGAIFWFWRKTL